MASKQQDVAKSDISPVLFMTMDGEPMAFFLRPGPVKRKLQPLINAGGGMLSNVQQPGAILLIDPEERRSVPESAAHWYVSTQYIHDCIEKDAQLNLEDYRLNPEVVPRQSPRLNRNKETTSGLSGGTVPYTAEEDAAILSYVSEHKKKIGGNRLWQEMEKQQLTSHSWQSMKYRYRVRLAKRQSEVEEVETTEDDTEAAEGETEVEGNQETDAEKPSSAEDAASPQTHSAESDQTQIDVQLIPSETTQPEIVEAQTSISPEEEVQHVNPQAQEQPAENAQVENVEAETSNSPQPEGPSLDPHTDAQPISAESAETDEPQTIISPHKESVPEDSPPAQPESLPNTSSQKKSKEKQKASPKPEQSPQRLTRRQLVVEEPYGKKLRSSTTSPGQPSSPPQPLRKTKSAVKSALQKHITVEEPPAKRARGRTPATAESQQEESGHAAVSETAQADTESNSAPQEGQKKKEKRKFGILELATKEFEDESESDEDGAPDTQAGTATVQPTSTEPPPATSDRASDAASTQSNLEHGLQENVQEASSSKCPPETVCPEPAAAEPAATKSVSVTSKAHLFIFDSESQKEDSQSIVGDDPVAPSKTQPTVTDQPTLTQVQLEEDKQRIRELMKQTNQDLVSVTKALLKTSGDFSAALEQLLNPSTNSGPLWSRSDDSLLLSADPVVRQQLQEKYGEEGVAKRIMFLEVAG
ncbi:telomeric repeat-binding factor 2-interacting protein 1 [Plectropomus leopardus]|uniref:telomeric repeat-binding factor 2-interacting protein 1 n=1 Tax=Plectropomus leopardus TaxID=160734 RepID=UPI001C4BF0F5|nr:telomeric repeat-binding factor 2-interacting protein 1 [Plectropomus leopardus]